MTSLVRHVVAPPSVTPYRYGLFSVAEVRTGTLEGEGVDEHWRFGVTWETEACGEAAITVNPCIFEPPAALTSDRACYLPEYAPFTVYAYNTDSLPGKTLDEHRQNAIARLQNGEQRAAEAALWTLLGTAVPAPTDLTALPGWLGLGWVEQALIEAYGSLGVLHMNRYAATALGLYIKPEGAIMRTVLGTPVVVGGGYDPLADPAVPEATIFGTGPVVMYRGDTDTRENAVDKAINDTSIVAQRDYVIGWDCVAVGAKIALACPVG